MLAISEINFDELYDESVLMFDSLSEEELNQILVEGIIPDKLKQKASKIINKFGKVDPKKKIEEIERKLKQHGVGAKKVKDIAKELIKLYSEIETLADKCIETDENDGQRFARV